MGSGTRRMIGPFFRFGQRRFLHDRSSSRTTNTDTLLYCSSAIVGFVGLVYASVPLYRAFCQKTGFGGTPKRAEETAVSLERLKPVPGARSIPIIFDSHVSNKLNWKFSPQQPSVSVIPGQTALAFYKAENMTESPITGVATYNVIPSKAAQYFNKIQCFCFEEQRLDAGENVDMPVFFYLDPEFAFDPSMDNVKQIILSYTFFKADST